MPPTKRRGLALLPAGSPAALLGVMAVATGFVAASWSGIVLAEVARVAPPAHLGAATSGVTLIGTAGYFAGPLAFAAGVTVVGWTVPLLAITVLPAVAALAIAPRLLRG